MLDKALYAWQTHTFLAIVGIIFGFVLVSMCYKWWLGSSHARKKAAKDREAQISKAKATKETRERQRLITFSRWSFGIAILVSLILAVYLYIRPF